MNIAYAQTTAEKATNVTVNLNSWDAIMSASPVVQLTLLALVGMSIVCWAIIFSKMGVFKKSRNENQQFLDEFWKADSLDTVETKCKNYKHSTAAQVFQSGYLELQKMAEAAASQSSEEGGVPQLTGADNIQRVLNRSIDSQVFQLESRLSILATTGATGPFIGLFGTVWGIMGSFQQIGAMKSASLAVVAPGISEALVATAIGLAAAIPAVMAYNQFMTALRREENLLNNFASDYLNVIKRNFFKDA